MSESVIGRTYSDESAHQGEFTEKEISRIWRIKNVIQDEFPVGLEDIQGVVWRPDQLEYVLIGPAVIVAPKGQYEERKYSITLDTKPNHLELKTVYVSDRGEFAPQITMTTIYQTNERDIVQINHFMFDGNSLTHAPMYCVSDYPSRREVLIGGCGTGSDICIFVGMSGKIAEIGGVRGVLVG